MKSAMSGFVMGFLSPWRGLALIQKNRRIRRLAILPFLLSVVVLVLGFSLLIPIVGVWLTYLIPAGAEILRTEAPGFLTQAVYWLSLIIILPIGAFILFYFLILIARILATPLIGLLAEKTLVELGVIQDQPTTLWKWLVMNVRLLRTSLMKAILFTFLAAILIVLSFMPFVGFVAAFGFLVMAAFDTVDASFEALQMRLKERLRFFSENLPTFFGFAAALGLVFLVPGLNFFFLPVSVVGGCDLVRRLTKG